MRLRARFTALFAILAAATVAVLVLVSDAVVGRAVSEDGCPSGSGASSSTWRTISRAGTCRTPERDAFLRAAAKQLECRVTYIAPDGRVLDDTDLLPADVPSMENHAGPRGGAPGGRDRHRELAARFADRAAAACSTSREGSRTAAFCGWRSPRRACARSSSATSGRMRLAIAAACLVLFLIGSALRAGSPSRSPSSRRAPSAIAAGDFATRPAARRRRGGPAPVRRRSADEGFAQHGPRARGGRAAPDRHGLRDACPTASSSWTRSSRSSSPTNASPHDRQCRRRPAAASTSCCARSPSTIASRRPSRTGETDRRGPCGCPTTASGRSPSCPFRTATGRRPSACCATCRGSRGPNRCGGRSSATSRTSCGRRSRRSRPRRRRSPRARRTGPRRAELLGLIRRQSDRMRELIDDLMDLAQIESGAVPLEREEIPLLELLAEVAEDLEPAARAHQVEVRVVGDASVAAVGDRRRLGQLARNLIDNAIKFSPERAPVVVRVGRQAGRAGFSVEDLGPGIPKAERDKIFQRFYQVDRSRSKVRPGLGTGAGDRQAHRAAPRRHASKSRARWARAARSTCDSRRSHEDGAKGAVRSA